MCISGRGMPTYMPLMNSLASTMWSGMLYTDDENAGNNGAEDDNDTDDNAPQLHKLIQPLANSA